MRGNDDQHVSNELSCASVDSSGREPLLSSICLPSLPPGRASGDERSLRPLICSVVVNVRTPDAPIDGCESIERLSDAGLDSHDASSGQWLEATEQQALEFKETLADIIACIFADSLTGKAQDNDQQQPGSLRVFSKGESI
jgi:hypothetical protein